jgi:hypothetical protein
VESCIATRNDYEAAAKHSQVQLDRFIFALSMVAVMLGGIIATGH